MELHCRDCKYDPMHATDEMKKACFRNGGNPTCYHPNAYLNGECNDYFWHSGMKDCFESYKRV